MRWDRPLAAALFGAASAPWWLVLWLSVGGVGWGGVLTGVPATALVAAVAGRALGAATRSDRRLWTAVVRGVAVGAAGVMAWTLGFVVAEGVGDGSWPLPLYIAGAVLAFLMHLGAIPWVLPGAVAGVAFRWITLRKNAPRSRRPIPRRARPISHRPAPPRGGP